jgi:hypothetical protein
MKAIFRLLLVILLFSILTSSCSKKKSQKEQYEEMLSSFKYKTYKAASVTTLSPTVKVYNEQTGKDTTVVADESVIRLLLGYNWAVGSKSEFAFAEADIIDADAKEEQYKFLTRSLRSIVMYENGWDSLAKQESDLAIKMASGQSKGETKAQVGGFYLIMGTMFVKRKDYGQARFYFAGFGQTTGINWPYQICDAMYDMDRGETREGLRKVKKMTQDPSVPEAVRLALIPPLEEIEKTTGDVNSSFFWPRTISSILFKEMKNSGNAQLQKITKLVEEVSEKVSL